MEKEARNFETKNGDAMTFTTEKPKVPGAYWWRRCSSKVELAKVIETPAGLWALFSDGESGFVDDIGCEWSSRLVPSDEYVKKEEVKKAFYEGKGRQSTIEACVKISAYEGSRARRVVDGREV